MTCYIGIIVYLVNLLGWKLIRGTKRVKAREMDLETDRRRFEEVEEEEATTRSLSTSWLGKLRRKH
jgi:amino acid transporter